MTFSPADMPRVAAAVRTAGELLEVHGGLMLDLTADWAAGAKAANLDPDSKGNRWETDDQGQTWPVPADPTGEAVLNARADTARELRKRLARFVEDAYWLRDMTHVIAPIVPPSTMNEPQDLWCSHHLRVGLCEARHRGELCRWCGDFMALWKVRPPVALLRDRHHGKRITERTVKEALAADGLIIQEVGGVTKAVRQARGTTGGKDQNRKRKAS